MATDEEPQPLGLRALEERVDKELFEKQPITAIVRFLACIRREGDQVFDVPKHVLAELARRFSDFMDGKYSSLDEAFGGRTARQRNAILGADRDYEIVFQYVLAQDRADELPTEGHIHGTLTERIDAKLAERFEMSEENVRRIWKESKNR